MLNVVFAAAIVGLNPVSKPPAHTQAKLVLSAETAKAGDTLLAGVHLRMDAHWHTYWKNPGEAGMATKIEWQLPAGITAGEIQWPVPEKLPPAEITTYGYENEVVLLVPLKLNLDLKPGSYELKAKLSWLECEQSCVPGSAAVNATLDVGTETKASPDAALFESWQKKLPQSADGLAARAWWEKSTKGDLRPLIVEWTSPAAVAAADFFPDASAEFEVQGASERLTADTGMIRLRKMVKKFQGNWPKQISGLLIQTSSNVRSAYAASMPVISASGQASAAGTTSSEPLWKMLLYGFIGGMILNVMPCVFPVIALKILGFVQQSRSAPQQVFRHGLVYALGVLVSFLVLAGVVIAVQRATGSASWGMQLQNPWFTLVLTLITLLVALNLFGVFEVNLGGALMNTAGDLSSRGGFAGTFFNGALATMLATPCTAPFLAPALGFAFAQPPAMIVLMFAAVAAGLAFPYVVLSWQPQWLKFLPRPGVWMEKFKMAMGFPMLATMVWLFSFNAKRFGPGGPLRIGLFLVLAALGAWVWGQFVQRGRRGRVVAGLLSVAFVAGGVGLALKHDAAGWQKWSPEAVQKAQAEGRPVLVDFTADWCATCQVNKRVAIDRAEVQAKLKEINAVTLVGDNTDEDPAIVAELRKFDRAGVPLVLVYHAKGGDPEVLPALLTPGIVLDALQRSTN